MPVELIRNDYDSYSLRRLARSCSNGYQTLRISAIADILDGYNRTQAATRNGMTRQTLRDWVHRYNEEGIDGLKDRAGRGRPARITVPIQNSLKQVLLDGPDLDKDGVVRWGMIDLQAWLSRVHHINCTAETVRIMVRKLGFRKMTARPQHYKQNPQTIEAFKKTLVRS